MSIAVLIIALGVFWLSLRPKIEKRDWFLVEVRTCTDKNLYHTAFKDAGSVLLGFNNTMASAHDLIIEKAGTSATLKHKDGGEIVIEQTVFDCIDAALLFYEREKIISQYRPGHRKIYVMRIVARLRRNVLTLPPEEYWFKEGRILLSYPELFLSRAEEDEDEFKRHYLINSEATKPVKTSHKTDDIQSRVLCLDGSCIGVIGADGHCKVCGKPHPDYIPA